MSFDYRQYELPEVHPVSPIDARLYIWEGPPEQELPQQQEPKENFEPQLSEISLSDDEITTVLSPFTSTNFESEKRATLEQQDRSSSIQHKPIQSSVLEPKSRRLFPTWTLAVSSVISTIFTLYYSYTVLVNTDAVPRRLQLTPSATVLIINILSHVVAFLLWALFSDTFEALRWSLACRSQGVLLTSFLALSRATPMSGVIYLCFTKGSHQLWAIWKILQMALITVLGLVLITDVTFKNVYTASNNSGKLKVVAGLAPLNTDYLAFGTRDILSLYTATYSMGFITDPKFVISIPPLKCSGDDCMAIFLPGGMDLVRRDVPSQVGANTTLFEGADDGDYSSIVIENAPGYHLEFDALEANYTFDPKDCTVYEESIDDGLIICLSADGPRMVAGWSICSEEIKVMSACYTNTTWMNVTDWGVKVSLFQRFATVAYARLNVSILTIESIGHPTPLPIDPKDFKKYHDIVLGSIPDTPLNVTDSAFSGDAVSYTAQYGIGWLLRLYKNRYEDYRNGGLDVLKGFLGVSFQFSTMMWAQWGYDTLPQNMHTTASLQNATYRALVQAWTIWAFGGIALLTIVWSVSCLAWVHFWGPCSPNASYFPEIDIVSKSNVPPNMAERSFLMSIKERVDEKGGRYYVEKGNMDDLGKLMRMKGLGNGMSRAVVDGMKGTRIYCGSFEMGGSEDGEQMITIVTERDKVAPLAEKDKYA